MTGFRDWLMKQNVLALAFAVVVGIALGAVIDSLVKDVIMPPVGLLLGRVNFGSLYIDLSGQAHPSLTAARDAGAPVIAYGAFLNAVITFVIVAFVVYLLAKALIREAPAAPTKECPFCKGTVALAATRCAHCTSALT